jgi:menaquinone-dependent protoporphyrinogen oxidase
MRVLFVFGTTEGHTRELCQFAARELRQAGHRATVESAGHDETLPDPRPYDALLLAASLHVGRYQAPLVQYARAQHETLNQRHAGFISVSLSAAGLNPHDWEGLEQCVARFEHETQWTPKAVHHAAGAIRYSQYDFFKRLAMKHIAHERGEETVTTRDYDLTDYGALRQFVLGFVEEIAPRAREGATTPSNLDPAMRSVSS